MSRLRLSRSEREAIFDAVSYISADSSLTSKYVGPGNKTHVLQDLGSAQEVGFHLNFELEHALPSANRIEYERNIPSLQKSIYR